MKYKTVSIKAILDSPSTNSGLKMKDVFTSNKDNRTDLLPVYSATKDENYIFGWVNKKSKWKSYKNLLTWVKEGSSSGVVCYRKEEFVPYEKVKLLELKPEVKKLLDYEYLRKIIELKLLSLGFGWGFKCSMERVMEVEIEIPVNDNEEYDLSAQKKLVSKYKSLDDLKNEINKTHDEFLEMNVEFKVSGKVEDYTIEEVFDPIKGNAKYTHKYLRDNKGDYPVYSSQTVRDGVIGNINSYDLEKECLTWTTDGIYAGTVFYRKGKFSMTTHCGGLLLKKEFEKAVNFKYVYFFLSNCLKDYAVGEGNKRITIETIKDVVIQFPVNSKGEIDIDKQKEIAKRYEAIEKIKNELKSKLGELVDTKIELN